MVKVINIVKDDVASLEAVKQMLETLKLCEKKVIVAVAVDVVRLTCEVKKQAEAIQQKAETGIAVGKVIVGWGWKKLFGDKKRDVPSTTCDGSFGARLTFWGLVRADDVHAFDDFIAQVNSGAIDFPGDHADFSAHVCTDCTF
jgi:hypothetical protein